MNAEIIKSTRLLIAVSSAKKKIISYNTYTINTIQRVRNHLLECYTSHLSYKDIMSIKCRIEDIYGCVMNDWKEYKEYIKDLTDIRELRDNSKHITTKQELKDVLDNMESRYKEVLIYTLKDVIKAAKALKKETNSTKLDYFIDGAQYAIDVSHRVVIEMLRRYRMELKEIYNEVKKEIAYELTILKELDKLQADDRYKSITTVRIDRAFEDLKKAIKAKNKKEIY